MPKRATSTASEYTIFIHHVSHQGGRMVKDISVVGPQSSVAVAACTSKV